MKVKVRYTHLGRDAATGLIPEPIPKDPNDSSKGDYTAEEMGIHLKPLGLPEHEPGKVFECDDSIAGSLQRWKCAELVGDVTPIAAASQPSKSTATGKGDKVRSLHNE